MPTLDEAADALYAQPPGEFVATRSTWVARARADGDKALAKSIGALRRPTAAAHAVNLLARRPEALEPLRDLGERLRAAQSRMDVDTMRALTRERSQLVDQLTQEAVEAGDGEGSAAVREQLRETFTAALADPAAEQAVCSGRLVTALSYAGFGEVDVENAVATRLVLVHSSSEVEEDEEDTDATDAAEDSDESDDAGAETDVGDDGEDKDDPADEQDEGEGEDVADTSAESEPEPEDEEEEDDSEEDDELTAAQERLDDAEESLADADALMAEAETELTEARAELARARDRLSAAMEQRDAARDERTRARQERRDARTALRRTQR